MITVWNIHVPLPKPQSALNSLDWFKPIVLNPSSSLNIPCLTIISPVSISPETRDEKCNLSILTLFRLITSSIMHAVL